MIVRTPLGLMKRLCERIAGRLPTLRGEFSFEVRPERDAVHANAKGWAIVPTPGSSVISPVKVYAGRVSDQREFWRIHDGFLPYGEPEPIVRTLSDLFEQEERVRRADSRAEKEDFLAWALGDRRVYARAHASASS